MPTPSELILSRENIRFDNEISMVILCHGVCWLLLVELLRGATWTMILASFLAQTWLAEVSVCTA